MPSVITHSLFGIALGLAAKPQKASWRTWTALGLLPVVPDLDVPLQSLLPADLAWNGSWSHRGFSHSIFFEFLFSAFTLLLFQREERTIRRWLLLAAAMTSHPLLDAFTNGGAGIEFLWPFSGARTHWCCRPIQVAGLSVRNFFTEQGWIVLKSEMLWVWLPTASALVILHFGRILATRRKS